MDASQGIIREPRPAQGPKEVFKLNPEHPDIQPVVPLDKLFDPALPTRVTAVGGKIGKGGVKDLIKRGGPDSKGKDLRNVPPDEYPTKYETPKQVLVELMLGSVNAVDSDTLQKAIALQAELAALDIQQADTKTLKDAYEKHWSIRNKLINSRTRANDALNRFKAAFKLGTDDRTALTPETSLLYRVNDDQFGVVHVLPRDGVYMRRDPNVSLWQELAANNREGSTLEWLQNDFDGVVPTTITADDLNDIRQPLTIHHKVQGDYGKYADGIFSMIAFDNIIVSGEETFSRPFGRLAQTAIFTALSEGDITTKADREEASTMDLDRNILDKLSKITDDKLNLRISRERQDYGSYVAHIRNDIQGEITQVLANQAALVGLTKLTLSDFDPKYMDIQNWVIVKRDGKLAYLKDALDETIAKAKTQPGKEQFVRLAEKCEHMMTKLHLAVEQATGERGGTQQGLVMTRDELFKPLKLDGGGEWRVKTPAEAHAIREMYLVAGSKGIDIPIESTVPGYRILDNPDIAASFLDDVYGIKVNSDPSKGPVTTEKDYMLMIRKTIAAQLPIYAGPDAFFLNKDFGEILTKVKEIIHAARTAEQSFSPP